HEVSGFVLNMFLPLLSGTPIRGPKTMAPPGHGLKTPRPSGRIHPFPVNLSGFV
ncbi:hypothetical protein STEG23_026614, partial [Scotinomys teguina]